MADSDVFFSHIAAVSANGALGLEGRLPWHIPEDLKYFKDKTLGKALIMGRKTFESLGGPLPDRLHIVVSRNRGFQPAGAVVCHSLPEAMARSQKPEVISRHGPEIFITGGGEIYRQTLSHARRLCITKIHRSYKGDTFYPEVPKNEFKEASRIDRTRPVPFSFLVFERIKEAPKSARPPGS